MWAIADHLQQILFLSLEQMHICKGVQSELECKKYVFITYKRKCWSNLQWISKWNYRPAKKKKKPSLVQIELKLPENLHQLHLATYSMMIVP